MSMLILGLNSYWSDASACLLVDGRVVAAAEEERFRRVKHWVGFPTGAIRYCLAEAGATIEDVDHLAVNRKLTANLGRRLLFTLRSRPQPSYLMDRLSGVRVWRWIERELEAAFPAARWQGRVHRVEHHLAHIASAFWCSPFDSAVALSVDGLGDFASAAWGLGDDDGLSIDGRVYQPHSLGIFYKALTQFLGFTGWGDEYKVMGLAPYGAPRYVDRLSEVLLLQGDGTYRLNLDYFRHHREDLGFQWRNCAPYVGPVYSARLSDLLGEPRRPGAQISNRDRDIARSTQDLFEAGLFNLLAALHDRYGQDSLCLAGGCAMNSVGNGKIYERSPFSEVYVPPAAGDAGGAIGAAATVWSQLGDGRPCGHMDHADWGPSFDRPELEKAVDAKSADLKERGCVVEHVEDDDVLLTDTAHAIADGQVVGWFQGRMEWGPRALGNRSILCDPRRADMKALLNRKIKRRESFRPFAPSILREEAGRWFANDDDVPFMEKVFRVREDRCDQIPAVVHVDGSGRLQTVDRASAPRYHALISRFREITGVPCVLNTSFNESEPRVHTPGEAIDCFLRTEMDLLVFDGLRIARPASSEPEPLQGSAGQCDARGTYTT